METPLGPEFDSDVPRDECVKHKWSGPDISTGLSQGARGVSKFP